MKVQNLYDSLKIISLVFFVFFISCQSKSTKTYESKESETQVESNHFFTIDFAEIIKHKREVPISEIAESVEYIPLENTQESMIGNIMDVQLTKDYIFIQHNGSALLTQFNRNGNFIRHFGTEGRGPKEYALMRIFSLDEKNKLVYIHTNWTQKILVFNFEGEYVKTIKFPGIERGHFTWSRDSFLTSFQEPIEGNESNVFIETNFVGDTIQKINNYIKWKKNGNRSSVISYWGRNEFYCLSGRLHMKGWYNDTIYTYDADNKFIPKFFVDLKEHKIQEDLIPEKRLQKPLPKECYWIGVNESDNYIFIRYGLHGLRKIGEGEYSCILYNKKKNEGVTINNLGEEYGFINDLNGGPNFKPRYSNDSLMFVDVTALDMKLYLDSDKFKNQSAKFPEQKEKLVQLNKTLKEDDNHFLMIARLKK